MSDKNKEVTYIAEGADDEEVEEPVMPKKRPPPGKVKRKNVIFSSSEPVDPDYKIVVIPKSDTARIKISDIIGKNFLFSKLDEGQKKVVVDAMFEVKKQAGDIIMNQGDKGDNFYVIDSGEVDVIISPGKGKPGNSVAHLKDGAGFGELALMYNSPRAATIKAITDVTLWAIDRSTYRHVMMDTVMTKRHKYQEFIKKVPFLSSLQAYEVNSLCDALIPLEYPVNATVINEGEPGSRFYIIEEGEVVVLRTIEGKGFVEVNHLKSSQYFGEIALLTPNAKRMATVKTTTPAKFLAVDGNAFSRLLGPIEPILKRNMDNYNLFMKK